MAAIVTCGVTLPTHCPRSKDSSRVRSRWAVVKEYLVQRWRQLARASGKVPSGTAPELELLLDFSSNILLPCSQTVTKGQALHQCVVEDTTNFPSCFSVAVSLPRIKPRPSFLEGGFAHHHTNNATLSFTQGRLIIPQTHELFCFQAICILLGEGHHYNCQKKGGKADREICKNK